MLDTRNKCFYDFYVNGTINIGFLNVLITEKCNLKCIDCGNFIPHINNPVNIDIENLIEDSDNFFRVIDRVNKININGGEPLLHPDLIKYIEYLAINYRNKVPNILITTNGTIIPSNELLKCIKKYNIDITISNYSGSNIDNYENNFNKLIKLLDNNDIIYDNCIESWNKKYFVIDTNTKLKPLDIDDKKLILHFKNCKIKHKALYEGKIYLCTIAMMAYRHNFSTPFDNEIIELAKIDNTKISRERFINMFYKFDDKYEPGYLSHCRYCYGQDDDFMIEIKRGWQ
jgi:organic radical activating enzyme